MVLITVAVNCYAKSKVVPLVLELESLKYDIHYNDSVITIAKDYYDMIGQYLTLDIHTTNDPNYIQGLPEYVIPKINESNSQQIKINDKLMMNSLVGFLFAITSIKPEDRAKTFVEFCEAHKDDLYRFILTSNLSKTVPKTTKQEIVNAISKCYEKGPQSFHMLLLAFGFYNARRDTDGLGLYGVYFPKFTTEL